MTKFSVSSVIGCLLIAGVVSDAQASDSFWTWAISLKRFKEVAVENDATYKEECSACHFPYQPGLLPARSWKKLLDKEALKDHFGDNAELDESARVHIEQVMLEGAADDSNYKRSRKVMASLDSDMTPSRITDVPYIKQKHADLPDRLIKQNSKVKSLSFCDKCHQKAAEGIYDDDTVSIPGKNDQ